MPPQRIAILGGGPIGLEAAVQARASGYRDVTVYERGTVADNVRDWGFVTLFTPWSMNTTETGWLALEADGLAAGARPHPDVCPSGNELRDRYLVPLSKCAALDGVVREHTTVLTVGRQDVGKSDAIGKAGERAASPFRLLVADKAGRERVEFADVVLDCTGTYGRSTHRWAGRGGVPAPGERLLAQRGRTWYTIPDVLGRDRDRFADRHTLLIGCGYSVATVLQDVERLQRRHPQTKVSWSMRRTGQALQAIHEDPLPARANLVHASMKLAGDPPPWLQFLGTCVLEAIEEGADGKLDVTLKMLGHTDLVIDVDEMAALVGYAPDAGIYEQLQVHQCYATAGPMKLSAALLGETDAGGDCLATGASLGPDTLRNPEPNFFILGAKSYGTNSNFLLQVGHRQVREVFSLIQAPAAGRDAPSTSA